MIVKDIRMRVNSAESRLELELYTRGQILNYSIDLPSNLKLIDLLNGTAGIAKNLKGDFIELHDSSFRRTSEYCPDNRKSYIQKSAIYFVALSEVGLGRGAGANGKNSGYPYVAKSVSLVTICCSGYNLLGNIYLNRGQGPGELLNGERQYIPLTDVTICKEKKICGYRPFAAVNRSHVLRLDVEEIHSPDSVAAVH
jgi:hypothetical protein